MVEKVDSAHAAALNAQGLKQKAQKEVRELRADNIRLEHRTEEPGKKPPQSRLYPMSGFKLQKVKEYLEENLQKGFISPSRAPYASPVLFVQKQDGSLRFCVDYRKLNAITIRNRYPIPVIEEALASVVGC